MVPCCTHNNQQDSEAWRNEGLLKYLHSGLYLPVNVATAWISWPCCHSNGHAASIQTHGTLHSIFQNLHGIAGLGLLVLEGTGIGFHRTLPSFSTLAITRTDNHATNATKQGDLRDMSRRLPVPVVPNHCIGHNKNTKQWLTNPKHWVKRHCMGVLFSRSRFGSNCFLPFVWLAS